MDDVPDPPTLSGVDPTEAYDDAEVVGETDYRRDAIAEHLGAGAWETAVERWRAATSLDDDALAVIADLEMYAEFDFFWDGFAGRVGYHAPGIPEDWQERSYHPDLESWGTVSGINAALTELGQTVCDVLQEEYVDWEADYDGPDDLPDF
jgi:hypothetical protein